LGAGGAALGRRIAAAAITGILTAVLATLLSAAIARTSLATDTHLVIIQGVWGLFILTILSTVGAAIAELALPEPRQGDNEPALSSQAAPSRLDPLP